MVDILKRALRMTSVGRQQTVLDFQRDVGRPDEADNHLIELPFAAGAQAIVTHNIRDVGRGDFPRPARNVTRQLVARECRSRGRRFARPDWFTPLGLYCGWG